MKEADGRSRAILALHGIRTSMCISRSRAILALRGIRTSMCISG
jgi:hypothetical protein